MYANKKYTRLNGKNQKSYPPTPPPPQFFQALNCTRRSGDDIRSDLSSPFRPEGKPQILLGEQALTHNFVCHQDFQTETPFQNRKNNFLYTFSNQTAEIDKNYPFLDKVEHTF